jgi:hypothetical protein
MQIIRHHLRLRVECTLFCNLQSRARTHAVLVIDYYELLVNPATLIIGPPGPSLTNEEAFLKCIKARNSIFPYEPITSLHFTVNSMPLRHTTNGVRRGFAPGFVNYKKGCTRLAAASDKVYQLPAHGRWFSPDTPASSTTKTGNPTT